MKGKLSYALMVFILILITTSATWAGGPVQPATRVDGGGDRAPVSTALFRDDFDDISGLEEVDELVAQGGYLQVTGQIEWVQDSFDDFYPGYGRGVDLYADLGAIVLARFSPDLRVNDVISGTQSQVDAASSTKDPACICAVWADGRSGDLDIYFAFSTDGGATWSENQQLNTNGYVGDQQHPAIAANDLNLHVIWEDDVGVHYTRSTNRGASWTGDSLLLVGAREADIASAYISPNTLVYVSYIAEESPGDPDVMILRSQNNGASWEVPENVVSSEPAGAVQATPHLVLHPNHGQAWAAWEDDRDGEINLYAARRDGPSNWFVQRVDDGPADSVQSEAVIFFLLSSNEPACLWSDDREGISELYWAVYNSSLTNWIEQTLPLTGPDSAAHGPAVGSDGFNTWAGWAAAPLSNTDTIWLRSYDGFAWGDTLVAPDQRSYVTRSSVAISQADMGGHIAALWSDDRNDDGDIFVSTLRKLYVQTGTYTSTVHDFAGIVEWGTISWVMSGTGEIDVQVRSGDTPEPDLGWSSWMTATNDAAIPAPLAHYLQYRLSLTQAASGSTPALEEIRLRAKPRNGAGVSLPVGQCIATWGDFSYDGYSPSGTTLTINILDISGTLLYGDVGMSTSLALLTPTQYPRLRAQVHMQRSVDETPLLNWWQFTWQQGENRAAFSYEPMSVYTPTVILFSNQSTGTVYPEAFSWAFGDGFTSTLLHPTHSYALAGTYTVTLAASGECGTDLAVLTLTVRSLPTSAPQAAFSHGPTCLDTPIAFVDESVDAIWWLWDFGDGLSTTLQFPSHTYTVSADYVVTLLVSNTVGQDAFSATLAVRPFPTAAFSYTRAGLTATFTSTVSGDPALLWDFGDEITSTEAQPVHTYSEAGDYSVTLSAANGCGEVVVGDVVSVFIEPEAGFFSNAPLCLGRPAVFTNTSSGSPLLAYVWEFGDGITSTQEHPSHTYAAGGTYTVSLDVSSPYGLDSAAGLVQVWTLVQGLSLTWEPALPLIGQVVTLTASATGTAPLTFTWDLGDGTLAQGLTVTHAYSPAGAYTVSLDVANRCGLERITATVVVTAPAAPVYRVHLPLVSRQHYGGDDFEPDNLPASASLLSLNSPQEHDFGPAGDVDWVYMPLESGTTYFIETRDLADGVDTSLALFAQGAYDTPLAENDDCSGYTYASCLSFTPAVSGRYELRVQNNAGVWGMAAGYVIEAGRP